MTDPPLSRRLLRIYLNDHLAGATAGVQVARRCLRNNTDTPLAEPLEDLLGALLEDRSALERLMRDLRFPPSRVKVAAATVGERLGRLKLNGRLVSYSPLSRLLELEALHAGVNLKVDLWLTLQRISAADPRLAAADFDRLIERARSQRQQLARHRLEAASDAFLG